MEYKEIIDNLKNLIDEQFASDPMHAKILNTNQKVLGIRTPQLRNFTTKICKTANLDTILPLKDNFWEETLVAGLSLAFIKDIDKTYCELVKFCNRIDNWATCDQVCSSLKIFKKDKNNKYLDKFIDMSYSNHDWTARVGLVMLMEYYLKADCADKVFAVLPNVKNHSYYVDMAVAWLISCAMLSFPDKTIELLKDKKLTKFVQNKAISKIRDSYRVSKEVKEELIKYRIK